MEDRSAKLAERLGVGAEQPAPFARGVPGHADTAREGAERRRSGRLDSGILKCEIRDGSDGPGRHGATFVKEAVLEIRHDGLVNQDAHLKQEYA